MPVFNDPTSPIGKSIPLFKSDIERLRKGGDDRTVAAKAYDLDPDFRALTDGVLAKNGQRPMPEDQFKKLPTLLLNKHYLGQWEQQPVDDLTATLSQNIKKPSLGRKIFDFATAPGDVLAGGLQKEIANVASAFGFEGGFNEQDNEKLKGNLRQTAEIAPTAGMMIGSAAGPAGSAAGGFAGQGVKQLIQTGMGEQAMSTGQQIAEPLKQGALAGTIDYMFGLAGKGISKVAGPVARQLGEQLPSRMINSLIKPAKNEFKFGKDPGAAIVNEGLIGTSVGDLAEKVAGRLDEIGSELASTIEKASVGGAKAPQIDMAPIIAKPIDEAIKGLGKLKRTNEPTIRALENLQQDLLESFGNTQTPIGVWQAKKEVQGLIKWNGSDPFSTTKNETLWRVFDGLRDALNASVPGAKELSGRYSELAAAKVSIGRRLENIMRQNIVGLIPSTLGGIVGAATGNGSGDRIGRAALGVGAVKALGSTAGKTIGAQALKAISTKGGSVVELFRKLAPAEKAAVFEMLQGLNEDAPPPTE